MKLQSFILLATAFCSAHVTAGESCDSLDACFARMHALAKTSTSAAGALTPEEAALTDRLGEFEDAVPRLVPLLASNDKQLAKLASVSLARAREIDAIYFPEIVAGLDRGLGWLPPALCAMPGEAPAREAVARFLASKSAPQNQEAFAVELCGPRALPFIVEAAKCAKGCKPDTHENLAQVLREMDLPVAYAIANPLLEIVRDPKTPDETARGVLMMIGALGKTAAFLEPGLLELRTQRPALARPIDSALVGLHANNAGRIMGRRLSEAKTPFAATLILRDIAELGADCRDAGDAVVKLLGSEDWDVRVAAARTLGFIDYQPAVPLLIPAIDDPLDVRLNWVAVESLGRLRNKNANDALQRASKRHWYAPVRRAAAAALVHIRDGTSYKRKYAAENFPFEFFAYEQIGKEGDTCKATTIAPMPDAKSRTLRATSEDVSKLKYTKQIGGQPGSKWRTTVAPQIALRVDDGWLTGANHGEFGGELMFIGDDRSQRMIVDENVHGLFKLGQRIVALTGLAHLGMNHGMIYDLHKDASGKWVAAPWRALAGSPDRALLLQSGELAIDVDAGGSIVVSPDGSMRMACNRP